VHLSAPVAVKCASRCLPPRCTNGEKANLTSVVVCRAGGPSHLTRPPGLQPQRVFTASGASALAGSASATLVDNAISLRKRSFRSLLMRIGSSADQEATRPQKVSRQQLARADVIYAICPSFRLHRGGRPRSSASARSPGESRLPLRQDRCDQFVHRPWPASASFSSPGRWAKLLEQCVLARRG